MRTDYLTAMTAQDVFRPKPTPLTRRQSEALAEYARHGTIKEAATCMGIGVQAVKNHLIEVHYHLGVETSMESLVALGWVSLPTNARHAA